MPGLHRAGVTDSQKTGKPYGIHFPVITIADMVDAQRHLMDHLKIPSWLAVAGGSMGGMQALQWAASYPERVRSVIPIATTLKHSPQQIAFDEVGRQAIMADPDWMGGDYYGHGQPERGLAVARMIGHITYMSDQSMEEKFSRRSENRGVQVHLRRRIRGGRLFAQPRGPFCSPVRRQQLPLRDTGHGLFRFVGRQIV
jgi:homoserine O-acetyltransferase